MPQLIVLDQLLELGACIDGRKWFFNKFGDGTNLQSLYAALVETHGSEKVDMVRRDWLFWLAQKLGARQPEILNELVECGFDVNLRDHAGWTFLMCVVSTTQGILYQEMVERLIALGADVNATHGRKSVLDFAKTITIQDILIQHGAKSYDALQVGG